MLSFFNTYYHFFLKSSSAHGVHSPFVYDLVSEALRKKRDTAPYYKKIKKGFPQLFKPKHIRILNDVIGHLGIKNYAHYCESNHAIDKVPNLELLPKTLNEIADLIYMPEENFNLHHASELLTELKKEAVLVIENPYSNPEVWEKIKEDPSVHILVDTYFFGFIFNRTQQAKEQFYIRL